MRKIHVLAFALFAVLAFHAFGAASAFAESEMLYEGAQIQAELLIYMEGTFLIQDLGAAGTPDYVCSVVFDADVALGGLLLSILELLMLETLELLDENGGTTGPNDMLDCENTDGKCENPVLFTALNLPWDVDIELMVSPEPEWLAHLLTAAESGFGEPEFDLDCVTLPFKILVEDKCSFALTSASLENMAGEGDVLWIFGTAAKSEEILCSVGGAETGMLEGEALIYHPGGGTLALS
jgi:hypothetical protein